MTIYSSMHDADISEEASETRELRLNPDDSYELAEAAELERTSPSRRSSLFALLDTGIELRWYPVTILR